MDSPRQRGVALITVMLVVAIATVLAVAMVREQRQAILGLTNLFSQSQARQYALGGEELARQILHEDFENQPGLDDLTEAWASNELFFEFTEGDVTIEIEDLQSRLNLNNLAEDSVGAQLTRTRFMQLTGRLGLQGGLADQVRDFVDEDQAVMALGAEDYHYLGLQVPYRTSGRLLSDRSELRLLADVNAEVYGAISPHVTVLPGTAVAININTASSLLLQALHANITPENAEALVMVRDTQGGFPTVEAFLQAPEVAGTGLSGEGLGVQSEFFEVRVRARFQARFAYLTSLIQRNPATGEMRVIRRNTSKKIVPVVALPGAEPDQSDA